MTSASLKTIPHECWKNPGNLYSRIRMNSATFHSALDYIDNRAIWDIDLFRMKLYGLARFQSTLRNGRYLFSGELVDFRNVAVANPAGLSFHNCDFEKTSFLGTDLSEVRFTSVRWPRRRGASLATYDELISSISRHKVTSYLIRVLSTEITELPYALFVRTSTKDREKTSDHIIRLQELYRDLKHNLASRGGYASGGEFHIAEKEMRRLSKMTGRFDRVILNLYSLTSGYGERYLRTLLWIFVVLGVTTCVYVDQTQATWMPALIHSVQVFAFRLPDYLLEVTREKAFKIYHLVYWTESLLGPTLIALFLFALRQRMKR